MTKFLVALAIVFSLTACGGDTISKDDEPDRKGIPGLRDQPTPTREYTRAELKAALLSRDDMPRGWRKGDDEDDDDAKSRCLDKSGVDWDLEGKTSAEISFQRSEYGPFFSETLTQLNETEAETFIEAVKKDVDRCPTDVQIDEDGAKTEITLDTVSYPDLGDETFALRMTAVTFIGPLKIDVAFVRIGGTVIGVVYGGFGDVDSKLGKDLADKAVQKLTE